MDAGQYFEDYLATEPEEATTLGTRKHDERLKDLSRSARAAARAFHERALGELADVNDSIDRSMMERLSRFWLRTMDRPNIELSRLPHVIANWHLGQRHDRSQIVARLAEAPRFLAEQEALLRDHAGTVDRSLLRQLLDQLPGAARMCDAIGARPAAEAYRRHGEVLRQTVLVHAGDNWAIGEEEYAWRLEQVLGIDRRPSDLIREAEEAIARTRANAAQVAHSLGEASIGAAVARVSARRPHDADDVVRTYRRHLERAGRFARDNELFDVPDEVGLDMPPMPDGWLPGAYVTNWPAPLLDPSGRGAFVIARDAAVHASAWAPNLAIHEGIPGHYLQSLAWQRRFGAAAAPVRFFLVFDDIAMMHQDYGPMLNIEGWAVWAEEVMLNAGFFEDRPDEELCARVSQIIRAARVLIDVSLHIGRMTPGEATSIFASTTGMSDAFARSQIARYMRMPLQAITYALGCESIRALRTHSRCRSMPLREFHEWLLSYGPVPPALIIEDLDGVNPG